MTGNHWHGTRCAAISDAGQERTEPDSPDSLVRGVVARRPTNAFSCTLRLSALAVAKHSGELPTHPWDGPSASRGETAVTDATNSVPGTGSPQPSGNIAQVTQVTQAALPKIWQIILIALVTIALTKMGFRPPQAVGVSSRRLGVLRHEPEVNGRVGGYQAEYPHRDTTPVCTTYTYKLQSTPEQERELARVLRQCCALYKAA